MLRACTMPAFAYRITRNRRFLLLIPPIGSPPATVYQTMVTARQQDRQQLADAYRHIASLVLTIDGLQPEKGHETLYTVREVNAKRVWFAEALLSSNTDEVRRLLVRAREVAEHLGKPVRLWMSDKQDAFVKGIAVSSPTCRTATAATTSCATWPSRCEKADSHAKVQMRKKVRGLRAIEREALTQRQKARTQTQEQKGCCG